MDTTESSPSTTESTTESVTPQANTSPQKDAQASEQGKHTICTQDWKISELCAVNTNTEVKKEPEVESEAPKPSKKRKGGRRLDPVLASPLTNWVLIQLLTKEIRSALILLNVY